MTGDAADPGRAAREAYADTLSEFNTQRSWYSRRSADFKIRSQRIDLAIILCGALIAAVPILKGGTTTHWTQMVASFLGAAVVVAQGAQRVFRYSETWPEYRLASERMKREWRLFINAAAPYDLPPDGDGGPGQAAKHLYIARLEAIIAEEQKVFFDAQRKAQTDAKSETKDST